MKQLMFSLLVAFSVSAFAQAPAKEAAKPEPMKEEPAKPETKPEAEKSRQAAAAPRKGPRRWNEDARHCLDKPTNTEIIKCAEEYL